MKEWIKTHSVGLERANDIARWIALAVQWISIFMRWWAFEKGTYGYNAMLVTWIVASIVWVALLITCFPLWKYNKFKKRGK